MNKKLTTSNMNGFYILIVFIHSFLFTDAQQNWDMSPQPPDVTAFNRYGSYDINYYIGSPSISIPLFSIDEKEISIPISLSYTSGGARVADESTWVGLGWNLYPGGSITRIIQGDPDNTTSYYDQSMHNSSVYNWLLSDWNENKDIEYVQHHCCGTTWRFEEDVYNYSSEFWINRISPSILGGFFEGMADNPLWFNPDIYIFNFLGFSGKFYIHPDTKQIVFLEQKEYIVFEKDTANWNCEENGWIATLPDGMKIYFQAVETVKKETASTSQPVAYPSITWKISKIILKDNAEIKFNYDDVLYLTASVSDNQNWQYVDDNDYQGNRPGAVLTPGYFINSPASGNLKPFPVQNNLKVLSSIVSPNYTVNFVRDLNRNKPFLKSVEILDNKNIEIKQGYEFSLLPYAKNSNLPWNHKYAVQNYPFTMDEDVATKYKLVDLKNYVIKNGYKNYKGNPHKFEYREDIGLPGILSLAQDYWGYYNGQDDNTGLIPDDTQIYAAGGIINENTLSPTRSSDNLRLKANSNRGVSVDHMLQGQLTKITYPTKGYSEFKFEPHKFYLGGGNGNEYMHLASEIDYHPWASDHRYEKNYSGNPIAASQGAGLRIKEIINKDYDDTFLGRKKFDYEVYSSFLQIPVRFWDIQVKFLPGGFNWSAQFYKEWTGSGSSYSQSFLYPNNVTYGTVVVTESDKAEDEIGEQNIGSIEHSFYNQTSYYNPDVGFISLAYYNSKNGLPDEIIYKNDNDNIIKSVSNGYSKESSSFYLAMVAKRIYTSTLDDNAFRIDYMPIKGEWWKKSSVTETYNGVTTTTTFDYSQDKYSRLTQEIGTDSQGQSIQTNYYYADDSSPNVNQANVSFLNSNDILTVPLRTETKVAGNIVSGTITNYNNYLPLYVSNIFKREKTGNYSKEVELNYTGRSLSSFKDKSDKNTWFYYDDDISKSPIVKFVNVKDTYNMNTAIAPYTASSLEQLLLQLDDISTNPTTQASWTSFNQTIRSNSYNSGTMIYTYTSLPLVGVTSVTDPKGYTMYYEYDALNRLKRVKDSEGKVLSENQYHYKGQQ